MLGSLCYSYSGATCTPLPYVQDAILILANPYIRTTTIPLDTGNLASLTLRAYKGFMWVYQDIPSQTVGAEI